MKNKKLTVGLAIAMAVLVAVFAAVILLKQPKTNTDLKKITVTVVYADKTQKEFTIETKGEFLGDALHEKGLVTDDEYKTGYYTVIDGVSADYNADGAFWSFSENGEWLNSGANEQPVSDGEKYEITYTLS